MNSKDKKTPSLVKYHLSKLTEVFQELLRIREEVDPAGIIAVKIFEKAEQDLSNLHKMETPSKKQIGILENHLIQIKHYLQQFQEYSKFSKHFFKKVKETIEGEKLQVSYPFLAAQNRAEQLFEDFKEGRHFKVGLQHNINSLKRSMRLFWKQAPALKPKIPIEEFEIFQNVPHISEKDFDLKGYLSEHIDTSPNKISATRIKQIKEGYYYLLRKSLTEKIGGNEYKLEKRLEFLERGLRKQNDTIIYKALRLIQQLVQPTAITSPTNYMNTQQKLIQLTGTSEPDSLMLLLLNNQTPMRAIVDKKGDFLFNDIELEFGKNTLICYNRDFLFLDNHKYHLHIHLERHYPFIGMHDPLTQKEFQENEAQLIVRCKTCNNYEYDFSVEENNNTCVFPKCEGRTFWNWEEREYWMEL